MAAQGERVSEAVVMCSVVGRPMVQDIPEQDIVMGELELPPQMDPKPEMGAAAAECFAGNCKKDRLILCATTHSIRHVLCK